MAARRQGGFTLIELMCVLCIIMVLVSMMLGPVMKAYKKAQRFSHEATLPEMTSRFQNRMQRWFGDPAARYPARTIEELHSSGYIDNAMQDFLRRAEVRFVPFSSETPGAAPILMVESPPGEIRTVLKADIRTPP